MKYLIVVLCLFFGLNVQAATSEGVAYDPVTRVVKEDDLKEQFANIRVTSTITNDSLSANTVVFSSSAKALGSIAPGNSGDVLTSSGAGVAPSFNPPTGAAHQWTNISNALSPIDNPGIISFATTNGLITFGPGTTNVLYRSGSDLVYTNGDSIPLFKVVNGSGANATMGLNAGGSAVLNSSSGAIYFDSRQVTKGIGPLTHNLYTIGGAGTAYSDIHSISNVVHSKFDAGGTNYSLLNMYHTGTNGNAVLDSKGSGTAGVPRPFQFAFNGTNTLTVDIDTTTMLSHEGTTLALINHDDGIRAFSPTDSGIFGQIAPGLFGLTKSGGDYVTIYTPLSSDPASPSYVEDTLTTHTSGYIREHKNSGTNISGLTFNGAVTLSGTTNQLSMSSSQLLFNGSPIAASGSGGNVLNTGTPVANAVPHYSDTTGTNIAPTNVTIDSTNIYTGTLTATNSINVGASGTAGILTLYDSDASNSASVSPNATTTTDVNMQLPAAPFTGLLKGTVSATTNWVISQATAGTDYGGGNVFNTGTPVVGNVARYSDTTGTNVGPATTISIGTTGTAARINLGSPTGALNEYQHFDGVANSPAWSVSSQSGGAQVDSATNFLFSFGVNGGVTGQYDTNYIRLTETTETHWKPDSGTPAQVEWYFNYQSEGNIYSYRPVAMLIRTNFSSYGFYVDQVSLNSKTGTNDGWMVFSDGPTTHSGTVQLSGSLTILTNGANIGYIQMSGGNIDVLNSGATAGGRLRNNAGTFTISNTGTQIPMAISGFSSYAIDNSITQSAGTYQFLQNNSGPAIISSASSTTGFGSISATPAIWETGSLAMRISGGIAGFGTTLGLSASNPSSPDLFLARDGAAVLQLGQDAATATAQAIKAHDGSGADKVGANMTLQGGQSTGTGRGGDFITQTTPSSSTSSTKNSYSTRSYESAQSVTLTESTATLFANISLAASKYAGARLICTINADDATDFQSLTSEVTVDAVNKGGTVTATLTQVDNTTAASAGTLTCTYTAVANGNGVDIKANAVSSLTQTTLKCRWMIVALNSDGVATVTPQ